VGLNINNKAKGSGKYFLGTCYYSCFTFPTLQANIKPYKSYGKTRMLKEILGSILFFDPGV
jgi:hypothetical protein